MSALVVSVAPGAEASPSSTTTGHRLFAVCQKHTAKPGLHTAKALPCVAHGKSPMATKRWQRPSLPWVFCWAHGKAFAVCINWTRIMSPKFAKISKIYFCFCHTCSHWTRYYVCQFYILYTPLIKTLPVQSLEIRLLTLNV